MGYADRPQLVTFDFKTADMAGAVVDNTDLFAIVIPAGKEVEIQSMAAYVRLASDGADFVELCKEDNTVIAKVSLASTGAKSALQTDGTTAQTFPQKVAPQSTTAAKVLKLRTDGATDTSTDVTVQFVITGL